MCSLPRPVDVGGRGTLSVWGPGQRTAGCLARGGDSCLPGPPLGEPRCRPVPSLPAGRLPESACRGTRSARPDCPKKKAWFLPLSPSTHGLRRDSRSEDGGVPSSPSGQATATMTTSQWWHLGATEGLQLEEGVSAPPPLRLIRKQSGDACDVQGNADHFQTYNSVAFRALAMARNCPSVQL